jgi:hypothetical protein
MGEAGRLRVEEQFTSTKMAAAMLQIYREILDEPCRSGVPAGLPYAEEEEVVASPAKWA